MFVDEKKHGEAAPDLGTLRVDRILALADEIENPTRGFGFDMTTWPGAPNCGTAACIGGHVDALFLEGRSKYENHVGNAAEAIGISEDQGHNLFYPDDDYNPYSATRARAARVLRHLAATGEVDWSIY